MKALALLASMIFAAGCATFRSSNDPWREVTTPHFTLRTNLDDKTAVEAAMKLESTRDDIISAAWPSFEFPEEARTEVYVLANGLDYEHVFGRTSRGMFNTRPRPAFYLWGAPSSWD